MVVKQFGCCIGVESLQRIGYVMSGFAVQFEFSAVVGFDRPTIVRLFGCYMVKPHGQLVQVSSTPHNAYTPCLSTS